MMTRMAHNCLQASTLAELLVVMIVIGILFLSVMDGMELTHRYFSRMTDRMAARQQAYEGYCRLESLFDRADSTTFDARNRVTVWLSDDRPVCLELRDSVLTASGDRFCDVLFRRVAKMDGTMMRRDAPSRQIDTLHIEFYEEDAVSTSRLRFVRRPTPAEEQLYPLTETETKYRRMYEKKKRSYEERKMEVW